MATAIIIIVLLGLLDTMLYLACVELEKYKEFADREIEHPRYQETVRELINEAPSIDIVRCKECRWRDQFGCALEIVDKSDRPNDDDYCSFGERKEGE